jgi:glycine oxidase
MPSCLILGAGAVGLSLAWELVRKGWKVRIVDRGKPGQEASWAGAGIIPPYHRQHARHPLEQLKGLSCELHPVWAARLRAETGIDNGFHVCGGLYLARTAGEAAALAGWATASREEGVQVERVTRAELATLEPALANSPLLTQLAAAYWLPEEAQLRNPRHVQALVAAVRQAGVTLDADVEARGFLLRGGRLESVKTSLGSLTADAYCVTAGAWTQALVAELGLQASVLPIRGQIVLFHCDQRLVQRVVNEGTRYVVPRDDGRVLAGSTEEEVGFDKRTTPEAVEDITNFARSLVPALASAAIEKTWAGFRPATFDGLPYLGPLPGISNAFIAAGHFRSGIYMSPGTAVVMAQSISGEAPTIDLAPFRLGR